MSNSIKKGLVPAGVLVASTTSAMAQIDVSGVALDVNPVETIGALILGALATIWVVRKVISILR